MRHVSSATAFVRLAPAFAIITMIMFGLAMGFVSSAMRQVSLAMRQVEPGMGFFAIFKGIYKAEQ